MKFNRKMKILALESHVGPIMVFSQVALKTNGIFPNGTKG